MKKKSEDRAELNSLFDLLEKNFGENAGRPVTQQKPEGVTRTTTGLMTLDQVLGGGLPLGRIAEIFGEESSGKTSICLQMISEVQKSGHLAAFIDVEHTLDPFWATKLGVDIDNMLFDQPMSGEKALDMVRVLSASGLVRLIVVDSVAALVPLAEMEGEMGEAHMGRQARLMGQALRLITPIAAKNNCTVVFTNQTREKLGGYGNPITTSGGKALRFYASLRLQVKRSKISDGDDRVGDTVIFQAIKNKVGIPYAEGEIPLLYDIGFDKLADVLGVATSRGVLTKSGSWYSYGPDKVGQGEAQAKEWLRLHPEKLNEIKERIQNVKVA